MAFGLNKPATTPDAIQKLEQRFRIAERARKPFDVSWLLDSAFYMGKQYVDWDTRANGQLITIPRGINGTHKNAPRPIGNKIYHYVMDSHSMAKNHDPHVEVLARSVDPMDQADADVAQVYLDNWTSPSVANWQARRSKALFWAVLCGEAWLKWYMDQGEFSQNRPCVSVCSPLEIYTDGAEDYLDSRWIMHVRGMDVEAIYDTYGVEIQPTPPTAAELQQNKILREIGMASGAPEATVKELWELPSRRFPKGRYIVWSGDKYLLPEEDRTPFPYTHGQLPFTQLGHSPIPGSGHYSSGVKVARPLQMELNQYRAQKTTARKKFTNFKYVVDSAMQLEQDIDDSDDQVLKGDTRNGTLVPKILQPQPWPDNGDGEWLVSDMQDALGIHGVSQGEAPGRVDSASGIQQLQEADQSRLAELNTTYDTAIGRGFGQVLELARQFVTEEQIVTVEGKNKAPAIHKFKTDRFPDQPILRVISGGLPKNRAARRAEGIALFQAQAIGQRQLLEILDYPVADLDLDPDALDRNQAAMENILMEAGIPVTAQPWQNHDVHRQVHDEWRKSSNFLTSPEKVWSIAQFHMDDTDRVELEEMQEEATRQQNIMQIAQQANPPAPAGAPPAPGADAAGALATQPSTPYGGGDAAPTPVGALPE